MFSNFSKTDRVTWNEWPITVVCVVVLRTGFLTFGLERKHVISSSVKYGGRARKGGFENSDDLFINYSCHPMSNDLTSLPENNTLLRWSCYAAQTRTEQPIFCRSYCNFSNITTHFWMFFFFYLTSISFLSLQPVILCWCPQKPCWWTLGLQYRWRMMYMFLGTYVAQRWLCLRSLCTLKFVHIWSATVLWLNISLDLYWETMRNLAVPDCAGGRCPLESHKYALSYGMYIF